MDTQQQNTNDAHAPPQDNPNDRDAPREQFRFKKVGEEPRKQVRTFDPEQINSVFEEDRDKFLGEFDEGTYTIQRSYLPGKGRHLRLYFTRVTPKGQRVAQMCIIHGFGEHSGRFLHLADFFARSGIQVHLIDLRGFGYSGGARGVSTITDMHQDIETLLHACSRELPLYLYGHSMGGLLVLSLAVRNPDLPIAGVISTSALLGFPKDRHMSWFKAFIVKAIGKKLEDIVVNSMIHPTALTKNNHHIRKLFGDRLMIPFLGMNMAKSMIEGMEYVLPNAYQFMFPLLAVHGEQDTVTNYQDTIAFLRTCSTKKEDKKLVLYPEGYHELQHDQECELLKVEVRDWILERAKRDKPFAGILRPLKLGVAKKENKNHSTYSIALLAFLVLIYVYYYFKLKNLPVFSKSLKLRLLSPLIYLFMKLRM